MPASSGDDNDSRTASVGFQRARTNNNNNGLASNGSSRRSSQDRKPSNFNSRRHNRNKGKIAIDRDVRDFVPQGATFSATPVLEVDPDNTSSSGSDSSSSNNDESDSEYVDNHEGGGIRSNAVVRTSLNGRANQQLQPRRQRSQFEEVNGAYWRSRSASDSSADGDNVTGERSDIEDGEVDSSQMHLFGDSDGSDSDSDSDSQDSEEEEADDSIMLNIGSRNRNGHMPADDGDDYDPEPRPVLDEGFFNNGDGPVDAQLAQTKEEALRCFSQKYATAPMALADLVRKDLEIQAKFLFYDREIHDIDLKLPIACTECLQEGHLAEVCPSKECVHCGAWNKHQSSFCPSWRRCQRCRERGHDAQQCPSPLKGSATETPCDFCGSTDHLELECDVMWKFPRRNLSPGPVLVSVSCSHCTSNRHLVGDCPSLAVPMKSSSWTLKGIDPNMVTNINSVIPSKRRPGAPPAAATRGQRDLKIRGRAELRSPSAESDDMMHPDRRPQLPPVGRKPNNRGSIRFGSGIGRNRDLAGPEQNPRPPPDFDSRRNYRDRQDYFGNNTRQRSLSPNPRPVRTRGKDSWQPPSRGLPQGRGGGAPPSRTPRGGGRGGGRGRGKRGENGDAYRPMPSAAKKAWDRYRL